MEAKKGSNKSKAPGMAAFYIDELHDGIEKSPTEKKKRLYVGDATQRAFLLMHEDKNEEAYALIEETAKVCEKEFGKNDAMTVSIYSSLATPLLRQRHYDKAVKILKKVLDEVEKGDIIENEECTKKDIIRQSALNLAVSLEALDKTEEALKYYAISLPILEEEVGRDHPYLFIYLHRCSDAEWNLGRYEESLVHAEKAANGRLKVLGPKHPDTLDSEWIQIKDLALLGHSKEALRVARPWAENTEALYGHRDLTSLDAWDMVALLEAIEGNLKEAEKISEERLKIRLERFGARDLHAYMNLRLFQDIAKRYPGSDGDAFLKKYEEAITEDKRTEWVVPLGALNGEDDDNGERLRGAMLRFHKAFDTTTGDRDGVVWDALMDAEAMMNDYDYDAAIALLTDISRTVSRAYGTTHHPYIVQAKYNRAVACIKNFRDAEARNGLIELLEDMDKNGIIDEDIFHKSMKALYNTLSMGNSDKEAIDLFPRLIRLMESHLEPGDPMLADAFSSWASVDLRNRDVKGALRHSRRAFRGLRNERGEDDLSSLVAQRLYVIALGANGRAEEMLTEARDLNQLAKGIKDEIDLLDTPEILALALAVNGDKSEAKRVFSSLPSYAKSLPSHAYENIALYREVLSALEDRELLSLIDDYEARIREEAKKKED